MGIVVLLGVTVLVVATPMVARGVALQPGAKALFYDPAAGQASLSPASPSPVTGLTPVQTLGTAFVGVHYWFANDRGVKFADPASVGLGARVRMHLRGNSSAFLTVWMSDSTHKSLELTTRSDAGPEGRWTGYRLERDLDYVVNGEFEVAPVERATRIIFLLARSQTEQVDSFSGCQEKLQRIASRTASDGGSVLVREVDRATPGQVGTYVVHRTGGQTGEGLHRVLAQRLPADPRTTQREKCHVDVGPFVVPDAQTSKLIQPCERPLDDPPSAPQTTAVGGAPHRQ